MWYIHDIKFGMLQVPEDEISLRKCCGGTAPLHTFGGTLLRGSDAICIDCTVSMAGKRSGLQLVPDKKLPNIVETRWMIHLEVLVAKHLGQSLSEALPSCVKIVNSTKARPLQSQMFSQLCDELGSEHSTFCSMHKIDGCRGKKCRTCVWTARVAFNFPAGAQCGLSFTCGWWNLALGNLRARQTSFNFSTK